MAKKIKQVTVQEQQKTGSTHPENESINTPAEQFSLKSFRAQAIILAFIAFIIYSNTFKHEYAFDDMMAIVSNDYVQQGFAGIGDIMTKDAYQSYLEHKNGGNQLAGGRYRPLSLVTFAIEQQFFGTNAPEDPGKVGSRKPEVEAKLISDMHTRHVINVLLYALSVVVLLYFLRKVIFPESPVIAFLTALLFTIHPLHTEVVANVKSRDEILSVLFIALTFIQAFKYKETGKKKDMIWGLVAFFLALLSKEYAVTLIALLPLSFYLLKKETIAQSFKSAAPFAIPFVVYMMLRLSSVTAAAEGAEADIMNNPYLYATGLQKIATEIMVLFNYLKLLVFPHPLTADYSFNQIPYTDFGNPIVLLSLGIHIALITTMCYLFIKRHILCFAIAIYLANLSLVSNILFNIGAPMGERLVYHSSIGFAMAVAYLLYRGLGTIKPANVSNAILAGLMIVVVALSGFKTLDRNQAWKNNNTLFFTDVKTSPNSVLVNTNAGSACMSYGKENRADTAKSREWFGKGVTYFSKAISINKGHMLAYQNRGLCYFNMGNPDRALADWDTVRTHAPNHADLAKYLDAAGRYFFSQGMKFNKENNTGDAIAAFRKAADAAPNVPDIWFNLGATCLNAHQNEEAKKAFTNTLQLTPNNTEARRLLELAGQQ